LVRRVEIRPDCIRIDVSRIRLTALLAANSIDLTTGDDNLSDSHDDIVTVTAAARLKRSGRAMKIVIDGQNDPAAVDSSLLRIVARAHDIQTRLIQNTELNVHEVARQEGVSAAYIYTLLRLPWLAPDITAAIVNGQQPPQLNAMRLMRLTARLPSEWAEQRALLGFR
jgi:hypothetical protein